MIYYKEHIRYDVNTGEPYTCKNVEGYICDYCGEIINNDDGVYVEIKVDDIGGSEDFWDQEELNNPFLQQEDVDERDITLELLSKSYHYCDPGEDNDWGSHPGCSTEAGKGCKSLVHNLLDHRITMLNKFKDFGILLEY